MFYFLTSGFLTHLSYLETGQVGRKPASANKYIVPFKEGSGLGSNSPTTCKSSFTLSGKIFMLRENKNQNTVFWRDRPCCSHELTEG